MQAMRAVTAGLQPLDSEPLSCRKPSRVCLALPIRTAHFTDNCVPAANPWPSPPIRRGVRHQARPWSSSIRLWRHPDITKRNIPLPRDTRILPHQTSRILPKPDTTGSHQSMIHQQIKTSLNHCLPKLGTRMDSDYYLQLTTLWFRVSCTMQLRLISYYLRNSTTTTRVGPSMEQSSATYETP